MLEENVQTVSALLKSISHPIRLRILCQLQDGEKSVGDIRSAVETTAGNISQHLSILRNQGVVQSRRDANYIYNRISDHRVEELVNTLQALFCEPPASERSNSEAAK
ncbi:MAG: metalloregulator ArsR/SmtB family transcription factor [Desulfobacteraceae bacterium]|jgi:DNA-binding transcriptional ArsR family regulator|nr:metalloregulator ArsR/SmtB family transcription factor [Desulfobacteraceae bacterium]